jgi:hypothetical protein
LIDFLCCYYAGLFCVAHLGIDSSYFDPQHDYDFTSIDDKQTGRKQYKGGEKYYRPCGWKRFALNVNTKNKDIKE